MTGQQQGYATGVTFVLLATVGWSTSGLFVRLLPELNGWQINCWRGYWVGFSLLIYLVAVYGRETLGRFRAVPLIALATSAGFFTLGSTLYVTSLTLVSTATVAVIGASSPIFTGLLSPWVTGERPGIAAWAAAALAMAGVGIIAWSGLEAGNLVGMAVSLLVPICFAGQTLALRRFRQIDMVPAICVGGFASFIVAGSLGFVVGFGGQPGGGFQVGAQEALLLAAMGVLQLAIPLIFYATGAKSVAAITLSLIVMLDAVLNPLWPWLALGETPSRSDFIGGTVIVGAVLISIFASGWKRRSHGFPSPSHCAITPPAVSGEHRSVTRGAATLIGFTAVLMWSVLALMTAASGSVPPFQLAAMTFLIGGLIGAVSWPFRKGSMAALRQPWPVWALGVGGLFGYHFVYFSAIRAAPAIEVSLIAYLWPLFLVVFSAFLPGERLKLHHVLGVVLGLAGATLVITRGQGLTLQDGVQTGHALAFLCAFIWAGYSVLSRLVGKVPTDVVAGFCLAVSALSLVSHLLFETTQWPQSPSQWLAVLGLGVLPVGAAFYTWDHGVKHGDIMVLGASSYAAPLLSALVLVLAGFAPAHWSIAAACLLITLGAVVAAKDMLLRRPAPAT